MATWKFWLRPAPSGTACRRLQRPMWASPDYPLNRVAHTARLVQQYPLLQDKAIVLHNDAPLLPQVVQLVDRAIYTRGIELYQGRHVNGAALCFAGSVWSMYVLWHPLMGGGLLVFLPPILFARLVYHGWQLRRIGNIINYLAEPRTPK